MHCGVTNERTQPRLASLFFPVFSGLIYLVYCLNSGYRLDRQRSFGQAVLTEIVYPPDRPFEVVGRVLQGAGTKGDYAFATIARVPFLR